MHAKTDSVVHARNQLSCARGCWCPYDGDDGDDDDDDDDDDDSKKDDKVAVPVCAQEHERYYPTPPHPTKNNACRMTRVLQKASRKLVMA